MNSISTLTLPNFQQLLNQFKGNLVFKRLVATDIVTPDEYLYKIETSDGYYFVFEIDFIENFNYITNFVKNNVGDFKYFVEVKSPADKFEDTSPFKVSTLYPVPPDFDEFKKYANDRYGSFEGYFNFLIKI